MPRTGHVAAVHAPESGGGRQRDSAARSALRLAESWRPGGDREGLRRRAQWLDRHDVWGVEYNRAKDWIGDGHFAVLQDADELTCGEPGLRMAIPFEVPESPSFYGLADGERTVARKETVRRLHAV